MRIVKSFTILAALGFGILLAQDAKLQFEVASVKPSGPLPPGKPLITSGLITGGPGTSDPEHITFDRLPFQLLIMAAYNVQRDQVKGPDWAATDDLRTAARFDISAKIPLGTTKAQVAMMLQNLLADRFQLVLHHEIVQVNGYALVVAKGGSKLKKSAGPVDESERHPPASGGIILKTEQDGFPQLFPGRNMGGAFKDGAARIRFRDCPLSDLIQQSSFALAAHIIDKTGLAGKYDFTLEYTLPQEAFIVGVRAMLPLSPGQTAPLTKNGPSPAEEDSVPIISSAMEKQLGLKLEAAKIPVDTLVIDRVEKMPTEN